MPTTQAQLRTICRTRYIKIDPNAKVWSNDVLDWYLEEGYTQIQGDWGRRWRENMADVQVAGVVNQQQYPLPADFVRVDLIRYNGQELLPTNKVTIKRYEQNFTYWLPYQYYIYQWNYGLDPIPNVGYTIDFNYFKKNYLTAEIDSVYPDEFNAAICSWAAYLAFLSVNKIDRAEQCFADYEKTLAGLLNQYLYDDMNISFGYQRNNWMTGSRVLWPNANNFYG